MTVSFKQFSDFLQRTRGDLTQDQIDEAWADVFRKREEEAEHENSDKGHVLTAKERLDQRAKEKKEKEEERKKELQKRRDQAYLDAKERAAQRKPQPAYGQRDNFNKAMSEGKTSYSEEGSWKDGAKAKGYKVKKLSGDLSNGDQTWGAFDGDQKVGEFKENDRGWLMEKMDPADTKNKNPGFFVMGDTDKVLSMDLSGAKAYLIKKIDGTKGATEQNTRKARALIAKASSVKKLAIDLSNFVLAHESAKNKVIR